MSKLYQIADIRYWKKHPPIQNRPVVEDIKGNKHLVKHSSRWKALGKINEMIVTKACEKANFDAVKNQFAYDGQTSIISRLLDYQIEPLGLYLPYIIAESNILQSNISDIFRQCTHPNDRKFKERFVDEFLLRALFEDTDAFPYKNISVKKPSTDADQSPLELSSSYDFDFCLPRDPKQHPIHCFTGDITKNLKYIHKHYPQNAEKFFADFSFNNATMDQLFDLTDAPEAWYILGKNPDDCLIKHSKSRRQNFEQNLGFLKDTFAKHDKKATFHMSSTTPQQKEGHSHEQ